MDDLRAVLDAASAVQGGSGKATLRFRARCRRGATRPARFVAGELDPYACDLLAEEMRAALFEGGALRMEIGFATGIRRDIEIRIRA